MVAAVAAQNLLVPDASGHVCTDVCIVQLFSSAHKNCSVLRVVDYISSAFATVKSWLMFTGSC